MSRVKKIVVIPLLVVYCLTWSLHSRASDTKLSALSPEFDIQAHRGGRDARPENTLAAFAYALAVGVTTLEMDMQITGDGVVVVRHNKNIPWYMAKNAWGKFLVSDEEPDIRYWQLADLKQFDLGEMSPHAPYGYWKNHGATQKRIPGAKVCTLEEVFQLVKAWGNDRVHFNIEAKSTPYPIAPGNPEPAVWVSKFYELVVKYGLQDRVMLQSFDWRTLREMKRVDPKIPTVALTANQPAWNNEGDEGDYQWIDRSQPSPWMAGLDIRDYDNNVVAAAQAIGADIVSPDHTEVSQTTVKDAHQRGLRIIPYTVNDPVRMRELIKMGVDGIITDRPATLRAVCDALGVSVPAPDPAPAGKPHYSGVDGL